MLMALLIGGGALVLIVLLCIYIIQASPDG
jgi:hypothetical protein